MPLAKFSTDFRRESKYRGFERRSYTRHQFEQVLKFKTVNPVFVREFQIAKSKNISQNGMLFKTVTPPPRKAFVLLEVDPKIISEFLKTENNFIVMQNKVVARVMRTHLNLENGLFEVGIRLLSAKERNLKELDEFLKSK